MKPKAKGLETLPFVTHLREFRAAKTIPEPFVFCFKFLNRKHKKVSVYTHTHTPLDRAWSHCLCSGFLYRRRKGPCLGRSQPCPWRAVGCRPGPAWSAEGHVLASKDM